MEIIVYKICIKKGFLFHCCIKFGGLNLLDLKPAISTASWMAGAKPTSINIHNHGVLIPNQAKQKAINEYCII